MPLPVVCRLKKGAPIPIRDNDMFSSNARCLAAVGSGSSRFSVALIALPLGEQNLQESSDNGDLG